MGNRRHTPDDDSAAGAGDDGEIDFGAKKKKGKKKKKGFDLDAAEAALEGGDGGDGGGGGAAAAASAPTPAAAAAPAAAEPSDFNAAITIDYDALETDFVLPPKKKRKKGKIAEEFAIEAETSTADDTGSTVIVDNSAWAGSDRDYLYSEMLERVFGEMRLRNPGMVHGERRRFVMKPPQVIRYVPIARARSLAHPSTERTQEWQQHDPQCNACCDVRVVLCVRACVRACVSLALSLLPSLPPSTRKCASGSNVALVAILSLSFFPNFVFSNPFPIRLGSKKSGFINFVEICKLMHRTTDHVLNYLFAELGTTGNLDGSDVLVLKGRFQQRQMESVLRRYIRTLLLIPLALRARSHTHTLFYHHLFVFGGLRTTGK